MNWFPTTLKHGRPGDLTQYTRTCLQCSLLHVYLPVSLDCQGYIEMLRKYDVKLEIKIQIGTKTAFE